MANQIPGKQLTGVLKPDVAVSWTVAQDANSQRLQNLGTPLAATDAARLQDIYNTPEKEIVRAASTANLALTGGATVDGVSMADNDRVLAKDQTAPSENGIWIVNTGGAWTRAADADSEAELVGAMVSVGEGSENIDKRYLQTTQAPITVDTTALNWIQIGGPGAISNPTTSNKGMTASVTTSDGDAASATAIASTPANGSYVGVSINGVSVTVGDGVKTTPVYFSGDGGTTARSFANIVSGDLAYWNGSIAGYQLAATDTVSFIYNTAS